MEREEKGPSTQGCVWICAPARLLPVPRAEATWSPCPWSSGEPHASSFLSSSATGWFSLPGPPSLPSLLHGLQFIPLNLPVILSQGLVPGAPVRFWAVGWAGPQNQGSSSLLLHFCKANPFTRIVLTLRALYYWSSCLGLLFYINKEMSKCCRWW